MNTKMAFILFNNIHRFLMYIFCADMTYNVTRTYHIIMHIIYVSGMRVC